MVNYVEMLPSFGLIKYVACGGLTYIVAFDICINKHHPPPNRFSLRFINKSTTSIQSLRSSPKEKQMVHSVVSVAHS
jgi:hypothetical protein